MLPVHRDVLEQVVEREGKKFWLRQDVFDRLRAQWSKLEDLVYIAWRDMVHPGQVRDAGCDSFYELLIPKPCTGDGFEDGESAGLGCDLVVADD